MLFVAWAELAEAALFREGKAHVGPIFILNTRLGSGCFCIAVWRGAFRGNFECRCLSSFGGADSLATLYGHGSIP